MVKYDISVALLHDLKKYFTPIVVILINGVICTSVLIVACVYLRKRRLCKSPAAVLPGIEIPFYNLLFGIAREFPSFSTMEKLSLPLTAYLQPLCSGVTALYPAEKALSIEFGFGTLILLVKAESVQEFLCSNVLVTKPFPDILSPLFGDGIFLSVGARWKFRRRLLAPVFHNDIINGIIPIFDKEAKVMVDILKSKHHEPWINVVNLLARFTLDTICKAFLGLNLGIQKKNDSELVNATERITQTMVKRMMYPPYHIGLIFAVSTLGRQFKKDINLLRDTAVKAIKTRQEKRKLCNKGPAENKTSKSKVIDLIIDCCEKDPDTGDWEMRDELLSFIFAGADTTSSALSFTLYLIGLHQEIQSKLFEEIDSIYGSEPEKLITADDLKQMVYLDCVLKEAQRLYPAGPLIGKQALEDFTFSDYKIKKGDIIVVDTYDLHRDPDVFPNPEVFDPERFLPEKCAGRNPYAYVPFSGGARNCLGSRFAMMEMKTVVANILHKFSLKTAKPRDKINTSVELVLRSCQPLNVKFTPRYIIEDFLQIFNAASVVFPGEKLVATRIVFQPLISLKMAEAVEEFLCSNVLQTKAFREMLLPFFGTGLFLSSGHKWKTRRKFATTIFRSDILKEFLPTIEKEAKVLVEFLWRTHHEPWIDVTEPLGLCSMDIICKTLMGIGIEAQRKGDSEFVNAVTRVSKTIIQRISNPLLYFEVIFGMTTMGRQFKKDIAYLCEFSLQVVKQRKDERQLIKGERAENTPLKSHFLNCFLDHQESNPDMSDENIRDELMSFIFAGADTTASALSWALYLIGLHPEIQRKIQDELDDVFGADVAKRTTEEDLKQLEYLDYVLKECQRLYPSVRLNGKYLWEDCTICDYRIKKGSLVFIDVYTLHRNPDVFPNPEVFDPDRFRPENCVGRSPYAYVPFSGGIRSCIGSRFAMMEMKTAVVNILHEFSLKSATPRDKINTSVELVLRS